MREAVQRAAELLRRSEYVVALTGAGISTPSGIPDFRTPHAGLWTYVDPLDVASVWAFAEHPERFYSWFEPLLRKALAARPNAAHRVLAEMEAEGKLRAVITQNFDSLHQAAGSHLVVELHGHTRTATCIACGHSLPTLALWPPLLAGGSPPRCPECQGILKPDVVLFGEPLSYDLLAAAQQEALQCDTMLVIGTSLEVMPAADLPMLARRRGARTVLVNMGPTMMDEHFDVVVHDDVARAMQAIWQHVKAPA